MQERQETVWVSRVKKKFPWSRKWQFIQVFCLEGSMDRGAWVGAAVLGAANNRMRPSTAIQHCRLGKIGFFKLWSLSRLFAVVYHLLNGWKLLFYWLCNSNDIFQTNIFSGESFQGLDPNLNIYFFSFLKRHIEQQ